MTTFLPDTNIWLALAVSGHSHHRGAKAWLDSVSEPGSIHFCRSTQQSFLRLLTLTAFFAPFGAPPQSNHEAWQTYAAFTEDDRIREPRPEPQELPEKWREYSDRTTSSPKLWMDAYLAAYASCSDLVLVTIDQAFGQFRGLRTHVITDLP